MAPRRPSVLVVGVSTRAIAESAARAGYAVAALDAFADLDLLTTPGVRALSLRRDFGVAYSTGAAARVAADLARTLGVDGVAYASGFENHPRAVALLAQGRALWGNAPEVLRAVRDPLRVTRALRAAGLPAPRVRASAPERTSAVAVRRWLVKARASGGGRRVAPWRGGAVIGRSEYLQEWVDGTPGSVVFLANGRDAVALALTRQLIGERDFGARDFRYCGSILAPAGGDVSLAADAPTDARLLEGAVAVARAVTRAFGLVGVNGVDFVARGGVPLPVEVNPRWSASMELAELAYGLSVFAAHVRACAGELPALDLAALRRRPGAVGKAVLFARRTVTVGDTRGWLASGDVRDVPHPGERIGRGHPLCTVFARGRDAAECRAALAERAAHVFAELERSRVGRARRSA